MQEGITSDYSNGNCDSVAASKKSVFYLDLLQVCVNWLFPSFHLSTRS